jgi:hypothetical protein
MKKERMLEALALVWQLRTENRGERKGPQSDPAFWDFLDEAHLMMELRQGMATLADAGRAKVQAVLDARR